METDIWAVCIKQSFCFRPQGALGQSPQRLRTCESYLRQGALMSFSSSEVTLPLGPQALEWVLLGARSGGLIAGNLLGKPWGHRAPDTRKAAYSLPSPGHAQVPWP